MLIKLSDDCSIRGAMTGRSARVTDKAQGMKSGGALPIYLWQMPKEFES